MTVDRSPSSPRTVARADRSPVGLAAAARSILACPAGVSLVVDGVDDVLAGMDELGMRDVDGQPVFSCLPDTPLAGAARARRSALLTLESGLGAPGSPDRSARLCLSGRLETRGPEDCDCCGEVRESIVLELNFALLGRADESTDHPETRATQAAQQIKVPLEHFRSPQHHLNRGFLQRSVEHANTCHQDELRRAVSTTTGTRLVDVAGVVLTGLLPDRVVVRWVDGDGAHARLLEFSRTARTTEELGELLRRELHAGLC